jgi:hypothetical protein
MLDRLRVLVRDWLLEPAVHEQDTEEFDVLAEPKVLLPGDASELDEHIAWLLVDHLEALGQTAPQLEVF